MTSARNVAAALLKCWSCYMPCVPRVSSSCTTSGELSFAKFDTFDSSSFGSAFRSTSRLRLRECPSETCPPCVCPGVAGGGPLGFSISNTMARQHRLDIMTSNVAYIWTFRTLQHKGLRVLRSNETTHCHVNSQEIFKGGKGEGPREGGPREGPGLEGPRAHCAQCYLRLSDNCCCHWVITLLS